MENPIRDVTRLYVDGHFVVMRPVTSTSDTADVLSESHCPDVETAALDYVGCPRLLLDKGFGGICFDRSPRLLLDPPHMLLYPSEQLHWMLRHLVLLIMERYRACMTPRKDEEPVMQPTPGCSLPEKQIIDELNGWYQDVLFAGKLDRALVPPELCSDPEPFGEQTAVKALNGMCRAHFIPDRYRKHMRKVSSTRADWALETLGIPSDLIASVNELRLAAGNEIEILREQTKGERR